MKFLKNKSFKKKKKESTPSGADESAGLPSSTNVDQDNDETAVVTPERATTSDVANNTESRQDSSVPDNNITPPSSPGGHSKSSKNSSSVAIRPLRLGSFNFDSPTTNGDASNQTRPLSFPPLFVEADTMLNLSNLIYTLAELRDLARNGVLNNPTQSLRILDIPLPLDTALTIINQEGELLKEVLDDGKHEATLSAVESLLARESEAAAAKESQKVDDNTKKKNDDNGMFGWMTNWDGCLAGGFSFDELFCGDLGHVVNEDAAKNVSNQQSGGSSSMITAVGDVKSRDELVYAVGVNPVEERITVIFRGSVTKADFVTDSKISIIQAPDPRTYNGTEVDGVPVGPDVGVHQGFYEYLFNKKEGSGKFTCKYDEIMNHVKELFNESPSRRNWKLYVTGHSLGGALATLFGFYAAASPMLPLPVTVVSIASPRVGNIEFARTFAEMESQGQIRHLRIVNHKDPVTLGPTISSKRALALSAKAFSPLGYLALVVSGNGEGGAEEVYYHTGIKLKLHKTVSPVSSQRCDLSYSGASIISGAKRPVAIDKDDLAEIEQSNRKKKGSSSSELPMVSYHYGTAYSERMALVESDLKGLTLNNVYHEKAC